MSSGLTCRNRLQYRPSARRRHSGGDPSCRQQGVGLFEFLIALLIFSTGMMGFLSTQIGGRKASFEAAQRSLATTLSRDMLERIRANAAHAGNYAVADLGSAGQTAPQPTADCDQVACTSVELAVYDLWQWQSLLSGVAQQEGDTNSGGLVAPRACITHENGAVAVTVSWLGVTNAGESILSACGVQQEDVPGALGQRRQVVLVTYVAGL